MAKTPVTKASPVPAPKSTPARNSPIPKPIPAAAPAARKAITHEMIAKRAFEIHKGGTGGDAMHNWLRAERELKASL